MLHPSLTLSILPNGALCLAAGNDARAAIKELQARHGGDDVSILTELTEPYWTNGSFEPFDAGRGDPFVGLTSAPCIAECMDVADDGQRSIDGRFWYFGDYMIRSPIDELKRRGRVIFSQALKGT
jgi:hypothetical protein